VRCFHHDHLRFSLPPDHRFPIAKYRAVRELLLHRGIVGPGDLHPSEPVPLEIVVRAHAPEYVEAAVSGALDRRLIRALGLPWSREMVTSALAGVGGTLAAARAALADGVAVNLGGGTHHAGTRRCAGFCLFNDLAITSRALLAEGAVPRLLVLDLDVHQGDGTAEMLAGEPRAFTCSLHGQYNFPFEKQKSDLDVGLADDLDDSAYLAALTPALATALERSRPALILYQAGVDTLHADRLGRLAMTPDGLQRRDRMVFEAARRLGVPIAVTLGGGYAEPLDLTVEAHAETIAIAREILARF
jgi:acetoin utilization deacetylase AcuC-like enzyme